MSDIKRVNFVNIPQELKTNASFCLWKYEKRNGRATKVPYDPRTRQPAKTNDTSTFSDLLMQWAAGTVSAIVSARVSVLLI